MKERASDHIGTNKIEGICRVLAVQGARRAICRIFTIRGAGKSLSKREHTTRSEGVDACDDRRTRGKGADKTGSICGVFMF